MSRILACVREPLVHFLIIGAALFVYFELTRDQAQAETKRIVVSQGVVEQLAAQFTRTWLRPPTEAELEGLIDGYLRDEVYYREALALGLDRDDRMVRQRMRQKLEFLLEDLSGDPQPSDADLQAFLEQHPERFSAPERVAFEQVYLNPDRREALDTDSAAILEQLRGGASPKFLGDSFMLGYSFDAMSRHEIERMFGASFAEQVVALEPGEWEGPVVSGFGRHLIRIQSKEPRRLPDLNAVRARVETDWLAEKRREQKEAAYRRLLEGYEVVVEERGTGSG